MSGEEWVVELGRGVWIAPIEGDPGRTLILASATRFTTKVKAQLALKRARKYRPFPDAQAVRMF